MKKIINLIAALICCLTISCAQLDKPEPDTANQLSSLKCYVHYDATKPALYETVDLLSGTYYPEKGLISYNFTKGEKFTEETLKKCRIEATIPSTARLELLDEAGNPTGKGLAGFHDLCNQTIWFRIVAANGDARDYQLSCKLK